MNSMTARRFIDTNVVVYAYDSRDYDGITVVNPFTVPAPNSVP